MAGKTLGNPPLKNPYHSESGQPRLRASWVVYMDILGFSEDVREAASLNGQEAQLKKLISALAEAKEYLYSSHQVAAEYGDGYAPFMVKFFTDNLVLGFPVLNDGESEFGQAIFVMGLYQFTLLKYGFFIRGGLSFGDLYMDEETVYGSSLLDAYEAESKLAREPRIVFAKSATDMILRHLTYYDQVATAPHNRHVLVDSDEQLFVSYLATPTDGMEGDIPLDFSNALNAARDLIVSRLEKFTANPRIRPKYEWAGSYHNMMVREYYRLSEAFTVPDKFLRQPAKSLAEVYQLKGRYLYKGSDKVSEFKSLSEYKRARRPQ